MKNERGAVTIIEAAFVFPIMFFIVFFMIMAGEGYYQYARVQNAVTCATVDTAARCENPMLEYVQNHGEVPTDPKATSVIPYRYILTSEAGKITGEAASDLTDKINKMEPLLFKGMKPSNVEVSITPKLNVFVSSITLQCSFEVQFPIKMIFVDERYSLKYRFEVKEPVGDPTEFVRNVSTVSDLIIERNGAVIDFVTKLKEKAQKIGVYLN